MKFSSVIVFSGVIMAVSGTAVIDTNLKQRFFGGGGKTENVMVSFTQGIQSVINQINRLNFSSPQMKRTALTQAQKTFTNGVQGTVKTFLNTMGVNYETFWISNKMVVPNVNSALVNAISNIPGVAKIEKEPVVNINPSWIGEPEDSRNFGRTNRQTPVEWGVKKVRANELWNTLTGKGVVVAGIDTGVRYTHETLRGRWRETYGWYDPSSFFPTSTPRDSNGHGTHTMATIAGAFGIGVAPNVTWIACRGCGGSSCTATALLKCGQWVQCPHDWRGRNSNCDMAPDVVSNSWGGMQGNKWYNDVISSWQTAEIIPVFSIGNAGPNCGTANSPGDQPDVISVGSTDEDNQISSFSSLGPSVEGSMKPDISAPGGEIYSAWWYSDSSYNTISGTSMACPHVSGVVALMLEKNPQMKYKDAYNAITSSAQQSLNISSAPQTCGNLKTSSFPNNVFGYGLIDAVKSVSALG